MEEKFYNPTPYDAERAYMALCTLVRAWETDETFTGFRDASMSLEEAILRLRDGVATSVLQSDWNRARSYVTEIPMEILEDIPDFVWNTIHLAGKK